MKTFTSVSSLQEFLNPARENNKKIGFVPTMGALHQGHLSLIETSKNENEITVCSIFVNPTQFNDPADFDKYPITTTADIALLTSKQCDVLFLPNVAEIYPNGINNKTTFDIGFLETVFDGAYRPGHFNGVCQVVERLLRIVTPDNLYLGQKDYQQCMVINKLVALMGWNEKLTLHIGDTKREEDGLAMSSRNTRLKKEERLQATAIFKSMQAIKHKINASHIENLLVINKNFLLENGFTSIDYLSIANATTLKNIEAWNGKEKIVLLVAAFIGEVRLIDNLLLN